MQFFIKSLIFLIVCCSASYGYFYYVTKQNIDNFIDSVRPFIGLEYQSFSNALDGKISINDVVVRTNFGEKIAHIDSVDIILDSATDYFELEEKLQAGEIPPKIQLKINHLNGDLDLLNVAEQKPSKFERFLNKVSAQGCGDVQSLDLAALPELGYSMLDASLNMNFEYSDIVELATFNIDLIAHDMNALYTTVSIPNIAHMMDFMNPDNEVNTLKVDLQDLGYNERVAAYCAKKEGLTVEQYPQHHIEQLKNFLNTAEIKVSDDIYTAYQDYIVKQAKLSFDFQPNSAVNLKHINLYPAQEWPRILGLSLLVNDEKVNDLAVEWNKEHSLDIALADGKKTVKQQQEEVVKRKRRYVEVSPRQLVDYINFHVKIETSLSKQYKGVVVKAKNKIVVQINSYGGKMDIPVDSHKIVKAFVYK